MKILPVALMVVAIGLSGCGGSETVVVDDHHEEYLPELRAFDIVDTYGVDTADPRHAPLVFDPYYDGGIYEVFWDVDSLEDYRVTLRINDRPTLAGSVEVHSQWCGAGRSCDQSGGLVCEYTSDYFMACDGSAFKYIGPVAKPAPKNVFMFIEICDSNSGYCEFDYYPVFLE